MRKGDVLWGFGILLWVAVLAIPASLEVYKRLVVDYPLLSSFFKFAMLATMGELLGKRIAMKKWSMPKYLSIRIVVWGFIGVMVSIAFSVFNHGVGQTQLAGLLPGDGSPLLHAFFTSVCMNFTFGPMLFVFHRCSDTVLEIIGEKGLGKVSLKGIVGRIDWVPFVYIVMIKTSLFFWIPAHTLVFLLPSEFRILASAFLSIMLGVLLGKFKQPKTHNRQN